MRLVILQYCLHHITSAKPDSAMESEVALKVQLSWAITCAYGPRVCIHTT